MNIDYITFPIILIWRNLKWLYLKTKYGRNLMVIDVFGNKMFLDVKKAGFDFREKHIFKQLALDRTREAKASMIMSEFIKPGDEILEVGANIGYYVLLEAYKLQGQGKVYALEPEPVNFELLRKNVEVNRLESLVHLHRLAVSDQEGQFNLYISKDSNLHSLLPKKEGSVKERILVDATTIDKFLSDKPKVNFIRMDIEGFECRVIHGMNKFLNRPGPLKLFIELHPHLVTAEEMMQLLDILESYGFEIHKLVSRDNFLRKHLRQTRVEVNSIAKFKNDVRLLRKRISFEAFFIKK